jgi:hypothetical protein
MLINVPGCPFPSTLVLASITCFPNSSALFHRPWPECVDMKLCILLSVYGCSFPSTPFSFPLPASPTSLPHPIVLRNYSLGYGTHYRTDQVCTGHPQKNSSRHLLLEVLGYEGLSLGIHLSSIEDMN